MNSAPKAPRVRLDWPAYFQAFCELHGEPVRWGKRLLFSDGWRYAALSHAGPEYPPPNEPAERLWLVRKYWELRLALVRGQRIKLETELRGYEELKRLRSAPLQESRTYLDGDKPRTETGPLNTAPLCERLVWLATEQDRCNAELQQLKGATDG